MVAHVPLTAIVWDFDGVLNANARRGRYHWTRDFEADLGQSVEGFEQAVFADLGPLLTGKADVLDRIGAWCSETGCRMTAEEVHAYWLDRDFHPDLAVAAIVARMAKLGLEQVVLTNSDARRADWVEEKVAHFPGVSRVFASARIGHAKPDRAAFDHIIAEMGRPAGEMYLIDDDARNANAAGGAGFRSFRYSPLSVRALDARLPRR